MRIFKNNKALTISETSGKVELTKDQIIKLEKAILSIFKDEKERVVVAYRGESASYMEQLYKSDNWDYNENKLLDCLFYFGSKAKGFYNKSPEERFISDLDNVGLDQSCAIFNQIGKVVNNKKYKSKIKPEFIKYFTEIKNKNVFIEAIINDKSILDYYIAFLHMANRFGNKNNNESRLVSTSKSLLEASRFKDKRNGDSYVLVYVMPRAYAQNAIVSVETIEDKLHYKKLPSFKFSELYPTQKEICIKRALFPHYILCVYKRKEKELIFNPHLFERANGNFELAITEGLQIDQCCFRSRLHSTNYKMGVAVFEDHFYKIVG